MKLHERPGYRRVPVTVVFHLYETIQEDWEDGGRFFVEENHYVSNYVTEMHKDIEAQPDVCSLCDHAKAYLGHIPFDDIRRAQEALPHEGFTPQTGVEKEGGDAG